eukprot:m.189744 g.189744  ORF g.189744 m.189744 type:complete len:537 (-) comp17816_c0_seq1:166-1776(-)
MPSSTVASSYRDMSVGIKANIARSNPATYRSTSPLQTSCAMDIDSENEAGGGGAVPRSSNDQSVAICGGTHAGDENVPPGAAPETPPQRPKKRVPLQLNTKRRRQTDDSGGPAAAAPLADRTQRTDAQVKVAEAARSRAERKQPAKAESIARMFSTVAPKSISPLDMDRSDAPSVAGLYNLGNTCYMNAVLQALRRCDMFRRGLEVTVRTRESRVVREPGEPGPASDDVDGAGPAVASEAGGTATDLLITLHQLFDEMETVEQAHLSGVRTVLPSVRPQKFHGAIGAANEMFNNTRQHDAQEFMHCLLDNLQAAEATLSSGAPDSSKRQKMTGATDILQGSLAYETRCCECEGSTSRTESFVDLTLTVEPASTRSVSYSLSQLCDMPERLDGQNKYFCETCNRFTEATRKLLLVTLPEVLVLHLNRSSGGARKVGSHVDAPRKLSLNRWVKRDADRPDAHYELAAIIFHSGQSSLSGHYTCYARIPNARGRQGETSWAFFDDENVELVSDDYVHSLLAPFSKSRATAYILFYHRCT